MVATQALVNIPAASTMPSAGSVLALSGAALAAACGALLARRQLQPRPPRGRDTSSHVQQPRAHIATVADEDAGPGLAALYNRVRNPDGTLDNVMSIHSMGPGAFRKRERISREGPSGLSRNSLHTSAGKVGCA